MSSEPRRSLGFWRCWSLVVGGTIGSAVFMMPAVMAPYGGIGMLSLVFATLGALAVALTFGALARRVTGSGGSYAYARAAFGDFAGFLVAWMGWISMWVACAALAIGFIAYLGAMVPEVRSHPVVGAISGLALIWTLVAINVAGVRESGIFSLVTTILKLTPLALISIVGLWFIDGKNLPAMHPGEGSALMVFASVFALSFWNFIGIETATVPSEDTVESARTIPRATLVGTLTVGAVYFLVSFVAMGIIPGSSLAGSEFTACGRWHSSVWKHWQRVDCHWSAGVNYGRLECIDTCRGTDHNGSRTGPTAPEPSGQTVPPTYALDFVCTARYFCQRTSASQFFSRTGRGLRIYPADRYSDGCHSLCVLGRCQPDSSDARSGQCSREELARGGRGDCRFWCLCMGNCDIRCGDRFVGVSAGHSWAAYLHDRSTKKDQEVSWIPIGYCA